MDVHKRLMPNEFLEKLSWKEANDANVAIWVLRLDKIHPIVSGNKWLKLAGWQPFIANFTGGVLSRGGAWSNHLHACSRWCLEQNIPFTAIIKAPQGTINPMIQDLINWNATIIYSNKTAFYDDNHWNSIADHQHALHIPMGGSGVLGMVGVSDFFDKLNVPELTSVVCAVGTGTTLAGIIRSALKTQLYLGIDPGTGDTGVLEQIIGLCPEVKNISLIPWQSGAKLKAKNSKIEAYIEEMFQNYALPLDKIYTATMFLCVKNLINEGYWPKGATVLLVHTGGLQGNRSQQGWPSVLYGIENLVV